MQLKQSHEDVLREELATASRALDTAREMLKGCEDLTPAEARANYRAALTRYAASLRRFSNLVVDGQSPEG